MKYDKLPGTCWKETRWSRSIGLNGGTMAMRSRPCIVKDADDADRLIWDGFCQNNLAVYLRNIKGRTAVIAKGCDSRAIVELIKENQIARERLVIIGVPCEGMVDRALIESELGPGEVEDVIFKHGEMKVNGAEFEKRFNRKDILHHSCKNLHPPGSGDFRPPGGISSTFSAGRYFRGHRGL